MTRRLGGRFILERELGSGGMSNVYLGLDEVLDRAVAIKILKPELMESDVAARFRREGRTAAQLSHPNIVQVYDAGEDELDGEPVSFIVMEHVPDGDLRALLNERGTLSGEEISNLSGVAGALAHAHGRGIVHRDIKPHNILLDENERPKVADFGIARALDATRETRTGTYIGTARYSSPEQLQGKEVTPKSDVYALGATLYETVTGSPPFGGTTIEIASQHVSKPPIPPGELALVDEDLEALILACLAKDPEERPTATEVQERLAETVVHIGAAGASAAPEPAPVRGAAPAGGGVLRGRRSSRRAPLLVALVVAGALLGTLGVFALLGDGERQAQSPVETTENPVGATREQTTEPATGGQPQAASQPGPVAPEDGQPNGSSELAAAQTVREVYELAAAGEYGASYELLSPAFQQSQAPTQAQWGGQFDTLERIRFLEGPDAEVTGGTARVTGVTLAEHTNRTERNTATWTLVLQDGQWKLNDLTIEQELV
ncbi:MAG: protein kinase [Rubrobacteraceae bacterium]